MGHVIEESSGDAAAFLTHKGEEWGSCSRGVTQHDAEVSRLPSTPTDGALVLPSWDGTTSLMIYDDELMEEMFSFIFHLLQTCGLFLSVTVDSSEHRESFLRKVTLFMDLQGRVRGGQSQGFSFPSHLHQTSDKSQFVIYERWKWETLKMATTQRNRAEGDADAGDASHCLLLHPNR